MTAAARERVSLSVSAPAATRRWAGWLLLAYLLPLAVLVLSARLGETGIPQIADAVLAWSRDSATVPGPRYGPLEAAANVLLFVPIGFLVAGMAARRPGSPRAVRNGLPYWSVWLLAASLSATVELVQMFLLTERSGTVRDLVCHSAGALIGVLVFRLLQPARHRAVQGRTS